MALFGTNPLLGGLLGVPIEQAAVWLNVVAGTLSIGVAYLLAAELFGNRRDALLCSIVFAVSGRVFTNSTTSEIYMLQTLFVLSSFYLFVRERVVLSGIACALALLVSPSSAFAYLFYPVYDYQRAGTIRYPPESVACPMFSSKTTQALGDVHGTANAILSLLRAEGWADRHEQWHTPDSGNQLPKTAC